MFVYSAGKNLYYATHSALAHHFRSDHFLCEEGECAGQHLTAVFRTEIDLKGTTQLFYYVYISRLWIIKQLDIPTDLNTYEFLELSKV